jgi:hypothetical protein
VNAERKVKSVKNPLFILAPPGSLNSLVCAMVGQHPEMYGLPEVNLFAGETYQQLTRRYGTRRCFQDGLLRATAELGLGAQTFRSIALARAWLQENSRVSTSDLFTELLEWAAPKTLVDGSRIYCLHAVSLPRLHKAFPKARYLHLLRHPKSTLASIELFPNKG